MTLSEHLKSCDGEGHKGGVRRTGAEIARIARRTKTSVRHLAMVANGYRACSVGLAQAIQKATKGSVPWLSLVGSP